MTTTAEQERVEEEPAAAETPDEPTEPTEPTEPEPETAELEPEPEPEPAPEGRKRATPQEQFQRAFAAFVKKAADVFEITPAEVAVAPHPGVVGIMLPGFAEPRLHADFRTCETCNGLGKVLTGAVTGDPTKDFHVCPDSKCAGRGYWQKSHAQQPPVTTGPLAITPPAGEPSEWGEAPAWMGDPNIGPGV